MAGAPTRSPESRRGGPHLVLYDGECGLCHGLVQFVLARDPDGRFHFAALQGPAAARHLASFGGVPSRLSSVYVLENYRQERPVCRVKARAALFLFAVLGWPWRAVSLLAVLPTPLLDFGYDFVARNRHRFFGRRATCVIPRAEHRDRFIDPPGGIVPGHEVNR